MSRFLRNVILAARSPGTSLQPRVPSLYADSGVGEPDDFSAEYGHPRLLNESMPAADEHAERSVTPERMTNPAHEVPQPRVAAKTSRLLGALQPPAPALRDDGQPTPGAPAGTPSVSDTAVLSSRALAPHVAGSARDDAASITTHEAVEGESDNPSEVPPRLRAPSLSPETPRRVVVLPPSQRAPEFESRHPRTAAGESATTRNDVEVHIGRIEVIAAAPSVRAPAKSAAKSPSLGDYLNGRRGRST